MRAVFTKNVSTYTLKKTIIMNLITIAAYLILDTRKTYILTLPSLPIHQNYLSIRDIVIAVSVYTVNIKNVLKYKY